MDTLDRAIIDELTRDGRLSNQELASRVGLTPAPCLRRVRRLEEAGIIAGYTARINYEAMDEGFEVLVFADLSRNDIASVDAFESMILASPQVIEFRRMFGLPDYYIKVRVKDSAAYERWYSEIAANHEHILRIDSRITMKLLKAP
ncbi:MAG TPA: Lrp/AsnC family transcriptional regulator [Candidatus Rothia avicola]|uniref:Lrp/AsnC family transcriptional regulator n=1 Tax=Candidatus Rothia avicola TaxID=2840478 RepID=A0A9D1ZPI9_9MICC|nr:Lrp/AsnC family transcriptional regulator [Candidatus Rothia avicola]